MKAYGAEAVQETDRAWSGQWWGGCDLYNTTCSENMKSCNTSYDSTFYECRINILQQTHIKYLCILWFSDTLLCWFIDTKLLLLYQCSECLIVHCSHFKLLQFSHKGVKYFTVTIQNSAELISPSLADSVLLQPLSGAVCRLNVNCCDSSSVAISISDIPFYSRMSIELPFA